MLSKFFGYVLFALEKKNGGMCVSAEEKKTVVV
jgi:hypothetical protein